MRWCYGQVSQADRPEQETPYGLLTTSPPAFPCEEGPGITTGAFVFLRYCSTDMINFTRFSEKPEMVVHEPHAMPF